MSRPNHTGTETVVAQIGPLTPAYLLHGNFDIAHFYEISKWLNVIFVTIIIALGIVGNYMAAIIFLSKYYKKFALRQHLVLLSCADLLFLISHYLDFTLRAWVNLTGQHEAIFNFVDHSVLFCKLFSYMRDVLRTISAYTLLLMTFQRFIRLYFPLKCGKWCAPKINRKLLMLIVVVSFAVNPADLFLVDLVEHGITKNTSCNVKVEFLHIHFLTDLTFACFTVFLPTMLIAILSFILWKKISSNVPKYYFLFCSCRHPDSNLDDYSSHQVGNYEPSQQNHVNMNSDCYENNFFRNSNSNGSNKNNGNNKGVDGRKADAHSEYEYLNNGGGLNNPQNSLQRTHSNKRKASNETSFSLNGQNRGNGRSTAARFLSMFKSSKELKPLEVANGAAAAQSLLLATGQFKCKSEVCLTADNGGNMRGIQSGNGVLNLINTSASMNNISYSGNGSHKSCPRTAKSSSKTSYLMNKIRIINLMRKGGYSIRATYILVLISKWFIVLQIPYFICWAITHSNLYRALLHSTFGDAEHSYSGGESSQEQQLSFIPNPATTLPSFFTHYYHKDLGQKDSGYRLNSRDTSQVHHHHQSADVVATMATLLNDTLKTAVLATAAATTETPMTSSAPWPSSEPPSEGEERDQLMPIVRILNNLFELLYLSSYSINFYLYMLNGPQFRKFSKKILYNHFQKMLSCFKLDCFSQKCRHRDHVDNANDAKA